LGSLGGLAPASAQTVGQTAVAASGEKVVAPQRKKRLKVASRTRAKPAAATAQPVKRQRSAKARSKTRVAKASRSAKTNRVAASKGKKKVRIASKKRRTVTANTNTRTTARGRLPRATFGRGLVAFNAPSGCLPGALKSAIYAVAQAFGPVTVNSTVRSTRHNRRVGGARGSYHLRCQAVDFRVRGSTQGLFAFLAGRPGVGGIKRYPLGFWHIDTGPRRSW
jgi:uncharacterized protein YcbK (DUF882 family)